ncbi:unnamed protein product, partial [Rotaria sp. Silwood2]
MEVRPIVCLTRDYVKGTRIEDSQLRKAILELPDNKTEHLPGYLPLITGMPILLTDNIATELGLYNVAKRTTKISIKRKALSLISAYSITTHKSQDQTLNKITVDLVTPPGPVEVASVYVPLSRVKRLDDLLI